jgi:hypothetical protein
LKLHIWNAQVGEAFHMPIQTVEVGLRNCVNIALTQKFGAEWWQNSTFTAITDGERVADLEQVTRRIRNRNLRLTTDQIVAGLSFGYWVAMLQPRYNPQIWSSQLRTAFPNLPPGRSRKSIAESAAQVATLRNRISHHEPLISRDLSVDFSNIMNLLSWICPVTEAWIRPHCRIPSIMRLKP